MNSNDWYHWPYNYINNIPVPEEPQHQYKCPFCHEYNCEHYDAKSNSWHNPNPSTKRNCCHCHWEGDESEMIKIYNQRMPSNPNIEAIALQCPQCLSILIYKSAPNTNKYYTNKDFDYYNGFSGSVLKSR